MKTAYRLSLAGTYTPVTVWMSMPFRRLVRWIDVISEVQAQDKKG